MKTEKPNSNYGYSSLTAFLAVSLRSFHWKRTYTEIFVKLCLLIVNIIETQILK